MSNWLLWRPYHWLQKGYSFLELLVQGMPENSFSFPIDLVSPPPILSGCSSNNDCPDYTACENRKCINPCAKPKACAPNANCRVTKHKAICTCPDGYVGSPQLSCSLRKKINFIKNYFHIYFRNQSQGDK